MNRANICVVSNCLNNDLGKYGKRFFNFPTDFSLCQKWLDNCNRHDLTPKEATKFYLKICEDHFKAECFVQPNTRVRLRKDVEVLPTIFNRTVQGPFQPRENEHQILEENNLSPDVEIDLSPKTRVEDDPAEYYECVLDPRELVAKTHSFPLSYHSSYQREKTYYNPRRLAKALLRLSPYTEVFGVNDLCCFCMDKLGYDFVNIFDDQSQASRELRQMCATALPPEVNLNICDGIPQRICRSCIEDVKKCYQIVTKILTANRYLRSVAKYSIYVEDEAIDNVNEERRLMEMQKEQRLARVIPSSALLVPMPIIDRAEDMVKSDSDTLTAVESDMEQEVVDAGHDNDEEDKSSVEELPDVYQEENQPDLDLNKTVEEDAKVDTNTITYDCGICHKPFPTFSALYEHRNRQHPNVRFKCDQCLDTYFENKAGFDTHMAENHKVECKYCQKIFFFEPQLQKHIRIKHEKRYKCRFCEKEFTNLGLRLSHETSEHPKVCWVCGKIVKNLTLHLKTHDKAKLGKFVCRFCDQAFDNVAQRNFHRQDVHFQGKKFECVECNERFLSEHFLQDHKELKHSEPGVFKYTCESCGRGFKTKQGYEMHKRRLAKTGICGPTCPREMMVYQPDEVMKRGKDKRRYLRRDKACDVCGRKFFLKKVLKRHRKYHFLDGDKSVLDVFLNEPEFHYCSDCGKRFYSKTMLMAHRATHTGEARPFHCEFCGKNYQKLLSLLMHYRIHTKETRYQCKFCDKRFSYRTSHMTHEKTHSKIRKTQSQRRKTVSCDKCGRYFTSNKHWEKHTLKCNGERRYYPCWGCDKFFATTKGRKLHVMTHHKEPVVEQEMTDEEAKLEYYIEIPDESGELVTIDVNGLAFVTQQE